LIIFPKLLSFLRRVPKQPQTVVQVMLQTHYLTSLAFTPLSVLLLLIIPFSSDLMSAWMLLAALPYFAMYARDLKIIGYRPLRDLLRAYALNLLLIPVHLTGAVTSVRQAFAGTKIPFRRTPKVSGRTRTSGLDVALQLVMVSASTALAVYAVSKMLWISAVFALTNAALLTYGIKQFIGFAEMKEDLLVSAQGMKISALNSITARWQQWASSRVDSVRFAVLQTLRVYASRHAPLGILLTLEVLSPALVREVEPSPNTIQLADPEKRSGWERVIKASPYDQLRTEVLPPLSTRASTGPE
jgi:hypothetical protein